MPRFQEWDDFVSAAEQLARERPDNVRLSLVVYMWLMF